MIKYYPDKLFYKINRILFNLIYYVQNKLGDGIIFRFLVNLSEWNRLLYNSRIRKSIEIFKLVDYTDSGILVNIKDKFYSIRDDILASMMNRYVRGAKFNGTIYYRIINERKRIMIITDIQKVK